MRLFKYLLVFCVLALSMPLALADKININTADQETLDVGLDGIGPKKAQAIIDYRTENGPFKTIDDLANVPGIGPKTIEKNRDKITVGSEPAETAEKTETNEAPPTENAEPATSTEEAKPAAAPTENGDKTTTSEDSKQTVPEEKENTAPTENDDKDKPAS